MKHIKFFLITITLCLLTSCYTVRLRSENGAPQPDPFSDRDDYYRGMEVVEIDTVINMKLTSKDFTFLIKESDVCASGKLNMVEYRNTFGGVLLSAITFGRKRKMKIKYVCEKP
ncbi:hypothetical protein [uncultured Psychroserpens sp.]|uniref:hypothetical protein n=1 Tax=uncultured Psychroserpens sp. TaxID=255436 RepID=UPI002633B2F0|nr:hypothetical protein [uncultured Psychroserpens sp.]